MYKHLKFLHLVGLCLFLASIAIHIVVGFVPGARDQGSVILIARQLINLSTWALAVPGLAVLAVTGGLMVAKTSKGISQRKWLIAHMALALLATLNAAVILIPMGRELFAVAMKMPAQADLLQVFTPLKLKESIIGGINLLLALAAIYFASVKPALRRKGD